MQFLTALLSMLSVFGIFIFMIAMCACAGVFLGCLKLSAPYIKRHLSESHDRRFQGEVRPINQDCFICLEAVRNQVVATCNHSFCGQCILNYVRSIEGRQVNCPACRKQILVLFRRFQPRTDQQRSLIQSIRLYNYEHTNQPNPLRAIMEFGNTIKQLPMLLTVSGVNHLLNSPHLKYLIFTALYTLSPVDLLPQAFLGPIGLLDDGVAVTFMARQISSILYGFVRQQIRRQ